MCSILHHVSRAGVSAPFRCFRLPDGPFSVDAIPDLFADEVARITGIRVTPDEAIILWNVRHAKHLEDYATPREYFLDDGLLGWNYMPKTRIPGERWRIHVTQTSHEISAVFQRIKMFREGYLTIEERLTRWGIVVLTASQVEKFQQEYKDRPDEWARALLVLDVCEKDIQKTLDFAREMHLLDPIKDLIPIRVLEVITVFRVLFRLSLRQFELAYAAYEH